jgi:hypothetical protein
MGREPGMEMGQAKELVKVSVLVRHNRWLPGR